MRSHVPDEPKLPECQDFLSLFDPTMRMEDRLQLINASQQSVDPTGNL